MGVEECDDGNQVDDDECKNDCTLLCGNDCWGDAGCQTAGGRCVRFTCTPSGEEDTACNSCFGWQPITHDQWMNQGYCPDVIAKYRMVHNYETRCGQAPLCCSSPGACAGADNAWHFTDGVNTWLHGPCLGCMGQDNCAFWNQIIGANAYTRITACER